MCFQNGSVLQSSVFKCVCGFVCLCAVVCVVVCVFVSVCVCVWHASCSQLVSFVIFLHFWVFFVFCSIFVCFFRACGGVTGGCLVLGWSVGCRVGEPLFQFFSS